MSTMERVSLRYGDCRAEVLLRGGQICSFCGADGREVIWQADPAVWAQHAPLLFPVCGSVKNDQVRIAGQTYPMKKHGFTRNAPFQIAKQGDDFVELVLGPTEESRAMYPFDFLFHVTYSLFDNGFTTTFLVENRSERVMPFCVGGHPAFICPMEDNAAFEDYQLVFPEEEDGKIALAPGGGLIDGYEYLSDLQQGHTLPLRYELFDQRDALRLPQNGGSRRLDQTNDACQLSLPGAVARHARAGDRKRRYGGEAFCDLACARTLLQDLVYHHANQIRHMTDDAPRSTL